jgi:serine/threonine-protein kinase
MRPEIMAFGAGDRVGQYLLGRELGRGAMATVYEAEHVALGKRVALKRMHAHLATDATSASRFLREGRAATQIRSPNVVEVFDVGSHEDIPYLVMELLEGVDLAEHLRERGRLSPEETADIMLPVACAVDAAHQAGVVHRDLKPSNIFLARRGAQAVSPIILDFGISKIAGDTSQDLTASAVLLGTVHYMSPEQTSGGRQASAASDQYALGVMLYECLTGAKPFAGAGTTPYAVMHAIVSARPPRPSALDPSLPAELDAVVTRAMHRDPSERFASVRDLARALLPWASSGSRERWARELEVEGALQSERASRRSKPRPTLLGLPRGLAKLRWAALAIVALAAATALGARSLRSHGQTASAPRQLAVPTTDAPPAPRGVPSVEAPSLAAPDSPGTPSASAVTPPRTMRRNPQGNASPSARTERGTNGALIVE